jgi:hypothetical protein
MYESNTDGFTDAHELQSHHSSHERLNMFMSTETTATPTEILQLDDAEQAPTNNEQNMVVVKSSLNEGKISFRLFLLRFFLSLIFIFLITSLIQLIFQLFSTNGSSATVNAALFFGLKLPYIGLLNSALICFSILPSFFGYTPSIIVVVLTATLISAVAVVLSFASRMYSKGFLAAARMFFLN